MSNKPFDKYFHYINSVQSAEHDAELIQKIYHTENSNAKRSPLTLQEDFCATADLCYEWAKLNKIYKAVGIDIDNSALAWGRKHHQKSLSTETASRVDLIHGNVFENHKRKADIVCALNFSYFFIHKRELLVQYFKAAKMNLRENGLLVLDCFGGPDYQMPHTDKRRNQDHKFSFWWVVESFDALSHAIKCRLDFQRDGEKIRKKVFSYDWRLWSVPEITDALLEAGFSKVKYWAEGLDKQGFGDGTFKPIKSETECEAWVCYIVAKK